MTKITLIMIINSEYYHEKIIQKILKNTVYDFELIWIKNYSSSETNTVSIQDSRITIKELKNNNLMQTLNSTVQEAKGKYIIFTNSLNILLDDTLKRGYIKLEENSADLLIFSNNTKETSIISSITQNKTFNYQKIKEHIFSTDYSLQDYLFDKKFLLNKKLQLDSSKNNDLDVFAFKTILQADKIILYKKSLNLQRKDNNLTLGEFKDYLTNLNDIQELFYQEEDENIKNKVNNYKINKSIQKYDEIMIKYKKEAFLELKHYFIQILTNQNSKNYIKSLNSKNRKKLEQIIISDSVEEYELLKKVSEDKKYVSFMGRYEEIIKTEYKKIHDFNKSLTSSNSWKITKFLRIRNK